jgi:hypothetical protein
MRDNGDDVLFGDMFDAACCQPAESQPVLRGPLALTSEDLERMDAYIQSLEAAGTEVTLISVSVARALWEAATAGRLT